MTRVHEGPWAKVGVIVAVIGVIVAVIGVAIARIDSPTGHPEPSAGAPAASTSGAGAPSSVQHSAAQPTVVSAASSAPNPPSASSSAAAVLAESLQDVPRTADGQQRSYDLRWSDGPVSLAGIVHPQALVFSCSLFCNGEPPEIYEVVLGRRYRQFTAVFGPPDTAADQAYSLQVMVDGQPPQKFTATRSTPANVRVSVEGALYLRLVFFAASPVGSPIANGAAAAGGQSPSLPDVALASPMLLP